MKTTVRRVFALLASLLVTWHAAAIVASILPEGSALRETVYPAFRPYLRTTGVWQRWKMFHTIPYNHDYEVQVFAIDAYGEETELGWVLPGLFGKENEHLRVMKLYGAFSSKRYRSYRDAYFENLAPAVAKAVPDAESYRVVMTDHRIRPLEEIRDDDVISEPETRKYGPFPLF